MFGVLAKMVISFAIHASNDGFPSHRVAGDQAAGVVDRSSMLIVGRGSGTRQFTSWPCFVWVPLNDLTCRQV